MPLPVLKEMSLVDCIAVGFCFGYGGILVRVGMIFKEVAFIK
jgi:hypothetical protein